MIDYKKKKNKYKIKKKRKERTKDRAGTFVIDGIEELRRRLARSTRLKKTIMLTVLLLRLRIIGKEKLNVAWNIYGKMIIN